MRCTILGDDGRNWGRLDLGLDYCRLHRGSVLLNSILRYGLGYNLGSYSSLKPIYETFYLISCPIILKWRYWGSIEIQQRLIARLSLLLIFTFFLFISYFLSFVSFFLPICWLLDPLFLHFRLSLFFSIFIFAAFLSFATRPCSQALLMLWISSLLIRLTLKFFNNLFFFNLLFSCPLFAGLYTTLEIQHVMIIPHKICFRY